MNAQQQILKLVIEYADQAHGEQRRKYSDDRYIVHPKRVMKIVQQYSGDVAMLSAAILHDVLEDTSVTKKELAEFLHGVMDGPDAHRTLRLVEELTDIYVRANFPSLNRRTRKTKEAERLAIVSADAQTIKYADIIDNSDVTHEEPDFARTYLRECNTLLLKMKDGNPDLRLRAMQIVQDCLAELEITQR